MKANKDLHYLLSHTISVVSGVLKVRMLQTRVPFVTIVRLRLETSRCNGVPAFCPVFSGLQTGSYCLSPACQISLGALGRTPSFKWFSPPKVLPLRASQRTYSTLRGSLFCRGEIYSLKYSCFEPSLHKVPHRGVGLQFSEECGMRDVIKASFNICIEDKLGCLSDAIKDGSDGIMT